MKYIIKNITIVIIVSIIYCEWKNFSIISNAASLFQNNSTYVYIDWYTKSIVKNNIDKSHGNI